MENIFIINPSELRNDFQRIHELMRNNGILTEKKSGRKYFTGYSYSTLYDWDQYFEGIVQLYLNWDTEYMKNAVRIFLDSQREDGFIARCVPTGYEAEGREHVKPFLSQLVILIYKRDRDLSWLDEAYYTRLKGYLDYWLIDRDINKENLSVWQSGPHTGMDNQHKRAGWWDEGFCQGVDLNSYLVRECEAFSLIAEILQQDGDSQKYRSQAQLRKEVIRTRLWDKKDGFFYDRNAVTGESIKVKSVAAFSTLWSGIATREQAERMVFEHLLNREEFWRPFPVPAYAASEEGYSEVPLEGDLGCCWRANTWIPSNYYVFQGLRAYGYEDIAKVLAYKTYSVVKQVGDREYYTSESVKGCGLDPFWGWSLLAYFMPLEYETGYDPTRLELSIKDAMKITVI